MEPSRPRLGKGRRSRPAGSNRRAHYADAIWRPNSSPNVTSVDPRSAYAASKLAQENYAASWARVTGGTVAALRYHNVYGPGMPHNTSYAGVAAIFLSALRRAEPPSVFEDGRQRRDFVHVRDVAAATVIALERHDHGIRSYNVGSGTPRTVGDMAAALSHAVGGAAPTVTGQYRLGDVRHITADSTRIRSELGWEPRFEFDAGMAELAANFEGANANAMCTRTAVWRSTRGVWRPANSGVIARSGRIRTCNLLIFPRLHTACLAPMRARRFGVKRGERVRAGAGVVSRQCVRNLHCSSDHLSFVEITPEAFAEQMAQYMPPPVIKMLLDYWSDTVAEPDVVLDTIEKVTGRPARTLAAWAADHRADFLA